ncbi:MAG: serine protease [Anaerolineales bacterium]|jgi:hypothetical protein|nr:serine protease [Anaerolineales bacterium]
MNTKHLFPLLLLPFLFVACAQASLSPPAATATDPRSATIAPTEPPTAAAGIEPTSTAERLPGSSSTLLRDGEGQNSAWRAIGRLYGSSTCTASFIASSGEPTAPAYALTNGHCIEWQANGVVVLPEAGGELVFNFFIDTQESQISVPVKSVPYSTMQGADIAIIELDATLGELMAQGLQPLSLADRPLVEASDVFVIGAPSSGLPEDESFLRLENCRLAGQVDLIEFNWHFYDTYRTNCQDIFGGSSGSPLFSAQENTIAAIINTTVEGISPCYLGVPCEIGLDGGRPKPGNSYAIPVHGLSRCFDAAGKFSLAADCPLPPGQGLTFDSFSPVGRPPLTWSATLTGRLPYYRYKSGALGKVDCRSTENYSDPIAVSAAPTIDDPLPAQEGFYLLCVLAGPQATLDESWQSPDHPTVMIAQIDTTPPLLEPQVLVRERGDAYQIDLVFEPPELSDYIFKFGPPDLTDCADEAHYERFRRIPPMIEKKDLPARLCVIAFDHAGNPTQPFEQLLSAPQ